ncbi:MAG: BspA family leucine-rich repeat surface protein, partial [Bacteroidales bacterium]|nr:BspA family leucine-rich repeat surface protein [Bacteroidales bacterium]
MVFDYSFRYCRPTSCSNWFYGGSNITSIVGMSENLNTENVTQAANMFRGCSSLTSIDLSRFNTAKITRMDYMFHDCSQLTELDLTNFNTAEVYTMQGMFQGCSALTTILVSDKWSVASLQHSESMFTGCGTDEVTNDTREAYVV